KHVVMLAAENFVTNVDDQTVPLVIQPPTGVIGIGCALLQDRVRDDHFARNKIRSDAEVFERSLSLRTPQLVDRNGHITERIFFDAYVVASHDLLSSLQSKIFGEPDTTLALPTTCCSL